MGETGLCKRGSRILIHMWYRRRCRGVLVDGGARDRATRQMIRLTVTGTTEMDFGRGQARTFTFIIRVPLVFLQPEPEFDLDAKSDEGGR